MKIIGQIFSTPEKEDVRVFTSHADVRQNEFRIHYHSFLEITFCLRGEGTYKTKEKTYQFKTGDFFLYRPNELHCITDITSPDGADLFNVHISLPFLMKNNSFASFFSYFFLSSPINTNKISSLTDSSNFLSIIKKIQEEFENKKDSSNIVVANYITIMLIEIGRLIKQPNNENTKTVKLTSLEIKNLLTEIDEKYKEDITLEDFAKKTGYSKNYLCFLFKQLFGASLWEYITIKRVEKCIELIRNSDMSITDIYVSCGFNNATNFNKQFKKYTGKTPRDFR